METYSTASNGLQRFCAKVTGRRQLTQRRSDSMAMPFRPTSSQDQMRSIEERCRPDRGYWARMLRRKTFSQNWRVDEEIREIASNVPSHSFLANPSGQYAYVYLTQFVKIFSEWHFARSFRECTVLDWGCGKGHVSKLIGDLGPKSLESCDVLSEQADSAFGQPVPIIEKFHIRVTALQHEYLLPYDSEAFDILLSVGVLEHVRNEGASMAEIARILKPGGLFFCFFLPTRFSWTQKVSRWRGENYHDRLYTAESIRELLSAVGLKPLDIWYRQLLPEELDALSEFSIFREIRSVDERKNTFGAVGDERRVRKR